MSEEINLPYFFFFLFQTGQAVVFERGSIQPAGIPVAVPSIRSHEAQLGLASGLAVINQSKQR